MIAYDFNHISEDDFERLVVDICSNLLGIGVHAFSKGRDGGKDGFFEGTAQSFPSSVNPWKGAFIIQAKHTTIPNASCSDNDFFRNRTSVLNQEINRLVELREKKDLRFDNYLLFTNRKLTGGTHSEIVKHLQDGLGIQTVDVLGTENLALYVEKYPELLKRYGIFTNMLPDRFHEKDIREVIVLFSQHTEWLDADPVPDDKPFVYTDKERKNTLNKVSEYYFSEIKSHSLVYFDMIDCFLRDPINREYRMKYLNTVSDIRGYIQRHINEYSFMDLLEMIADKIIGSDMAEEIFVVRKLVRVFVHYMYWNCDIGQKE